MLLMMITRRTAAVMALAVDAAVDWIACWRACVGTISYNTADSANGHIWRAGTY